MKKTYNLKKLKEIKNPYSDQIKKSVGINLSHEVLDYFKDLSDKTGIGYQRLIDMYLLDCVKKKRKIDIKWTA